MADLQCLFAGLDTFIQYTSITYVVVKTTQKIYCRLQVRNCRLQMCFALSAYNASHSMIEFFNQSLSHDLSERQAYE
jgi:hypothetical protein